MVGGAEGERDEISGLRFTQRGNGQCPLRRLCVLRNSARFGDRPNVAEARVATTDRGVSLEKVKCPKHFTEVVVVLSHSLHAVTRLRPKKWMVFSVETPCATAERRTLNLDNRILSPFCLLSSLPAMITKNKTRTIKDNKSVLLLPQLPLPTKLTIINLTRN